MFLEFLAVLNNESCKCKSCEDYRWVSNLQLTIAWKNLQSQLNPLH